MTHPLGSLLIACAATWFFAWLYYKRAGDELRREAELLRKAADAIIYFLEHPTAEVEARRDSTGRVVGVVVSAVGRAEGRATAKAIVDDASKDP